MVSKIAGNIYVGDDSDCNSEDGWVIIHACKTCFKKVDKNDCDLYLNMIDPIQPLFNLQLFKDAVDFINKNIKYKKILIHCNKGMSRSPSIAMLYVFGNLDYGEAQYNMSEVYNKYQPSLGIDTYMEENWEQLKQLL